jgi:hypothetical protein
VDSNPINSIGISKYLTCVKVKSHISGNKFTNDNVNLPNFITRKQHQKQKFKKKERKMRKVNVDKLNSKVNRNSITLSWEFKYLCHRKFSKRKISILQKSSCTHLRNYSCSNTSKLQGQGFTFSALGELAHTLVPM